MVGVSEVGGVDEVSGWLVLLFFFMRGWGLRGLFGGRVLLG